MHEAMFYKKINKKVQCELCARKCIIPEGSTGFCRVRKNQSGKLYSLVYGKLASVAIDPIQKKPFYHWAPGSQTLSMATVGCDWACSFCCNYLLSQEWKEIYGEDYTPEQVVGLAISRGLQGLCYTYIEPTVFLEFAYDCAKAGRAAGIYSCWVSNGYTSPEAIKKFSKYLDAAVIDFKCSGNPKSLKKLSAVPDPAPIYDALLEYKKQKVFLEITDLLIPKYGDDMKDVKKLCRWIVENLGPEIPVHFIRFFPAYKLDLPFTPIKILEKAYETAKKEGLNYVYLGNIPHKYESTFCPSCGKLLIKRSGIYVEKIYLKNSRCQCGRKIPLGGKKWIPKELLSENV